MVAFGGGHRRLMELSRLAELDRRRKSGRLSRMKTWIARFRS
jgi:hypothetical protein